MGTREKAVLALNAGDLHAAETHMFGLRAENPYDPNIHLQLGVLLKALGRVDEAIGSFQFAERLQPGWDRATDELMMLGVGPLRPYGAPDTAARRNLASAVVLSPPAPTVLWDETFYRDTNPELVDAKIDLWRHFLTVGAAAGRSPHFLFSVTHYLAVNPDIAETGANPLLHFLQSGWHEGRSFHWWFSPLDYKRLHPDLDREGDPLGHFLRHGLAENRRPHELFDPLDYLARYPDVASTGMPAFEHFLRYGDKERRSPHILFDPVHYRRQHELAPGVAAFEHYWRANPLSDPHPLFHSRFYHKNEPAAGQALNPLLSYVQTGAVRGRAPHPLFDPAYYLCQAPAARGNPLLHYIKIGAEAGLSPHPLFDPDFYRKQPGRVSWNGATLPTVGPRISLVVPVYNTPPAVLEQCIGSVMRQSYTAWELCLVDDASTDVTTVAALERYRGVDRRIKVVRSPDNLHISRATNLVAQQATGEFLAFLDHDDMIAVEALAEVALAVNTIPDVDLLYTDEDKIDQAGRRSEAYHKPDWSPDHLLSVMYVLHLLVIRKSLFWSLGGLREERSGAQDYDLVLRASRKARRVHHIPRVLYHWRKIPGSAAESVDAKPYALQAARAAVADAVAEHGMAARVEDGLLPGTFRVRYSLAAAPPVTLLIFTNNSERDVPGRGRINLLANFLGSIAEKSTYGNYRLLVVDNANTPLATRKLVKKLGGRVISYNSKQAFSYARKANFATKRVSTEHVVYLNDDLEVISPGWIEALLELLQVSAIGGVGGRLLYPDGRLQHSGVVLGPHGGVGHAFWSLPREHVGYMGYTHLIRNYSAVSGAVFATRLDVMNAVGGFDEHLKVDYNDIDLCLRIGDKGLRTAFTPYCELYHFEGSTQVRTAQAPEETAFFHERWRDTIDFDPYYNPNLPRDGFSFS